MENLICNAEWDVGYDNRIEGFRNYGPVSVDSFCWDGNRTCSLSLSRGRGNTAGNCYELPIGVSGDKDLVWGYTMRVIEAECILLRAAFCDACGRVLSVENRDVTRDVGSEFNRVSAGFRIPREACMAFVSLHFEGLTTACTFCAPFAYYGS